MILFAEFPYVKAFHQINAHVPGCFHTVTWFFPLMSILFQNFCMPGQRQHRRQKKKEDCMDMRGRDRLFSNIYIGGDLILSEQVFSRRYKEKYGLRLPIITTNVYVTLLTDIKKNWGKKSSLHSKGRPSLPNVPHPPLGLADDLFQHLSTKQWTPSFCTLTSSFNEREKNFHSIIKCFLEATLSVSLIVVNLLWLELGATSFPLDE